MRNVGLDLQKYMTAATQCFGFEKNVKTSLPVTGTAWDSLCPVLSSMNCFSLSDSHLASLGKSVMQKKARMPIRVVAMPSSMKTHRQLLRPRMPSILPMALERRPPKAPAQMVVDQ